MNTPPILSLGLTPALQRTMVFDRFHANEVNRSSGVTVSAAGKAVNVGMALACLGDTAIVAGFNGGTAGRRVATDMRRRGAVARFTPIPAETRTCTTIMDRATGQVTELVEEAPAAPTGRWSVFLRANLRLVSRCRMLTICGTLPPSTPNPRFYEPFASEALRCRMPWLVDSHREPLLSVLRYRPLVAKLNVRELEATFGTPCSSDAAIVKACRRLISLGAHAVLVTAGASPAWLLTVGGCWRMTPPVIRSGLNPIGSGDCTTAGFAHHWLETGDLLESVRFGLACGAANVLTMRPADFDPAVAAKLVRNCRVEVYGKATTTR